MQSGCGAGEGRPALDSTESVDRADHGDSKWDESSPYTIRVFLRFTSRTLSGGKEGRSARNGRKSAGRRVEAVREVALRLIVVVVRDGDRDSGVQDES